ncbi:hypothetical protein AX17_001221 [Amanita inopinata Kibby_2008]|nr:hypothetical protein AX17_001221 [Amanita inopinata Kibby_2008]
MFPLLLLLPVLLLSPAYALSIHHKIYHPHASSFNYTRRGHVSLHPHVSYSPSSAVTDITSFIQLLQDLNLDPDAAYYQIALERDDDESAANWDVSSVKLCHLRHATSDSFTLHVKDTHVYAIDYFVSPIPHDGACSERGGTKVHHGLSTRDLNTTVSLDSHRIPPLPELHVPPALSAEGEPVEPVPEKTFLQKYWMYILALLIALLASGGNEEAQPRRSA